LLSVLVRHLFSRKKVPQQEVIRDFYSFRDLTKYNTTSAVSINLQLSRNPESCLHFCFFPEIACKKIATLTFFIDAYIFSYRRLKNLYFSSFVDFSGNIMKIFRKSCQKFLLVVFRISFGNFPIKHQAESLI
jgi:hypothetical protein